MPSFSATTAHTWRAGVDQRAHDLVGAGRVLDQQQQQPPVADRDPLEAPERSGDAPEPAGDLARAGRRASGSGARGERVVDVVEARERELPRAGPSGATSRNEAPLEPAQLDLARGDVERRPRVAARGQR